jgi:hypothetical protein
MTYLFMIVFAVCMVFMFRTVLILGGMYKDPLLRLYEQYGPDEIKFQPVPWLLLTIGGMLVSSRYGLRGAIYVPSIIEFFGWLMVIGSYVLFAMLPPKWRVVVPDEVPLLPGWHRELHERTTREERRRIAYMWIRLPLRLRLLYNASDRAFFQWADLVIMATVH